MLGNVEWSERMRELRCGRPGAIPHNSGAAARGMALHLGRRVVQDPVAGAAPPSRPGPPNSSAADLKELDLLSEAIDLGRQSQNKSTLSMNMAQEHVALTAILLQRRSRRAQVVEHLDRVFVKVLVALIRRHQILDAVTHFLPLPPSNQARKIVLDVPHSPNASDHRRQGTGGHDRIGVGAARSRPRQRQPPRRRGRTGHPICLARGRHVDSETPRGPGLESRGVWRIGALPLRVLCSRPCVTAGRSPRSRARSSSTSTAGRRYGWIALMTETVGICVSRENRFAQVHPLRRTEHLVLRFGEVLLPG